MATSKNSRKKGRKRSASHAAPPGYVGSKKQEQIAQQEEADYRDSRKNSLIKWTGLFLMLIGFWLLYYTNHIAGYIITIAGALIGFFAVRSYARFARLSKVCYGIYIAMMVFIWCSGGISH
jgi:hypothetical protein